MNTPITSFLVIIALSVISCEKPIEYPEVGCGSGEYLKIVEGTTAMGGFLDETFHFMIIPDPLGEPMMTSFSMGGAGYSWDGWFRFPDHKYIGFEAKCDRTIEGGSIKIGKAIFDLKNGEVFYLPRDSEPRQIAGSKAGHRDDPQNPNRLSELLKQHQSEHSGTGQPATASELDSEGGDKPQPEVEGRSR